MDNLIKIVDHYVGSMKIGLKHFKNNQRAQGAAIDIVLVLVMIVVIGAIGIFVADKTLTAIGTPSNGTLNGMLGNILTAASTGSSFTVILVIAFVGGIAISYLFGMMGGRRTM